jgi:hypothetical protein
MMSLLKARRGGVVEWKGKKKCKSTEKEVLREERRGEERRGVSFLHAKKRKGRKSFAGKVGKKVQSIQDKRGGVLSFKCLCVEPELAETMLISLITGLTSSDI